MMVESQMPAGRGREVRRSHEPDHTYEVHMLFNLISKY